MKHTYNVLAMALALVFFLPLDGIQAKETSEVKVNGMMCGNCSGKVKTALQGIEGVEKAKVDLEYKLATVDFDETKVTMDMIHNAISEAGFEPVPAMEESQDELKTTEDDAPSGEMKKKSPPEQDKDM